ncbi:hypothetical protein [Halopseudomonas laoshanensis]|uniref:hypothetical protein n=1 Tax=Halopseudomonas laoshanensis TaxID=2268758 RepID=UPI0037358D52
MDVGLPSTAANVGDDVETELEVNAVVEPGREVLELNGSIDPATVDPLIRRVSGAKPGEKLLIYIRANGGGSTEAMFNLIECLATSQADVELAINRYAMSAAATLWLWFILDPIPGVNGVGRVVSVDPLKPTVLLMHRPRLPIKDGTYYCFLEDVADEGVKQGLADLVAIFDSIFERLLERLGIGLVHAVSINEACGTYKHYLHYARDAYYSNYDYVLPLEG